MTKETISKALLKLYEYRWLSMRKRISLVEFVRGYCLIGIAFFISLYMCTSNTPLPYKYLFMIPFVYGICNAVFITLLRDKELSNFAIILLHGLMFLRMVIAPLLLTKSGSDHTFSNIQGNMPQAIGIIVYEMICIYIIAYIAIRKQPIHIKCSVSKIFIGKCKIVIFVLAILLVVCLALAPSVVKLYRTVFGFFDFEFTGFDSRDIISQYATSTIKKFGIVTFRYVLNAARLLIPCIILLILRQRKTPMRYVIPWLIGLVVTFNFVIMDDTLAYSVCNTLIILVYFVKLNKKPTFFRQAIIVAVGLVVAYFGIRFFLIHQSGYNLDLLEYISSRLQSYFSGVTNIAAGLNIPQYSLEDKWKLFSYEILRGVPYASTVFRLDSTSMGRLFNLANGSVGQIVPMLSSSRYYFGAIFAPLLSCLAAFIGIRAGANIDMQENPLKMLSSIIVAMYAVLGFTMYSLEITSVAMFCLAIPIYIVGVFADGGNKKTSQQNDHIQKSRYIL